MSNETALTFGAAGGFGTFAGWELQSDTPNTQSDRASTLGPQGDEVSSNLYNMRTESASTYKCSANTNTVPAVLGKLYNGRILTSIGITTSNSDRAQMTLNGHQHAANTHADTLKQTAHGIQCPKAFGAIDFMGGTGATGSAVASGSVTITVQHNDKTDADGAHLVGENYNGMMTAQTSWTGPVTTAGVQGWDTTSSEVPVVNTDFISTNCSGTKSVALSGPQGPS